MHSQRIISFTGIFLLMIHNILESRHQHQTARISFVPIKSLYYLVDLQTYERLQSQAKRWAHVTFPQDSIKFILELLPKKQCHVTKQDQCFSEYFPHVKSLPCTVSISVQTQLLPSCLATEWLIKSWKASPTQYHPLQSLNITLLWISDSLPLTVLY